MIPQIFINFVLLTLIVGLFGLILGYNRSKKLKISMNDDFVSCIYLSILSLGLSVYFITYNLIASHIIFLLLGYLYFIVFFIYGVKGLYLYTEYIEKNISKNELEL